MELENYNSLMSIYTALNLPCIKRLTKTWKEVPKSVMMIVNKINATLGSDNSFSAYKQKVKFLTRSQPFVACHGIFFYISTSSKKRKSDQVAKFFASMKKKRKMKKKREINIPFFFLFLIHLLFFFLLFLFFFIFFLSSEFTATFSVFLFFSFNSLCYSL